LQSYMEAFDIVLINDQSMTVPNAILRQILYAAADTSNCDDAAVTNHCDTEQPNVPPAASNA